MVSSGCGAQLLRRSRSTIAAQADEMKRVELWRWRYYDPVRKRKIVTRFVLSEADAAVQYPQGAEKVENSLEVRMVPETDEERAAGSTSAWQRRSPNGSTDG